MTVYGGVHPTYHFQEILAENPAVDVVVRGEGEATVLELVTMLSQIRGLSTYGLVFGKRDATCRGLRGSRGAARSSGSQRSETAA